MWLWGTWSVLQKLQHGPLSPDPFGEGATKGVCGATADIIVARNLLRSIAAGLPLILITLVMWPTPSGR